jgi:hypothetical protein
VLEVSELHQILLVTLTVEEKKTLESRYEVIEGNGFEGVELVRMNDDVQPLDSHLKLSRAADDLRSICQDLEDSFTGYKKATDAMTVADRRMQVYRLANDPVTHIIDTNSTVGEVEASKKTRVLLMFRPLFNNRDESLMKKTGLATTVKVPNGIARVVIKTPKGNGGIITMKIESM